jgi:carboxymethylenebutenolidase
MPGTDIRYATRTGESLAGYLTGPAGGAPAPGILLITAIFGVDGEMRDLADAWAADGFLVSVPDIFWFATPDKPGYDATAARESCARVRRRFRAM